MTTGRFGFAAFLSMALFLCAPDVTAQPEDEEALLAQARAHLAMGMQLFEQGEWARALAELQRSFELDPNPALRYAIGRCHYHLGCLLDARRELRLYLVEVDPSRIPEERRHEVQEILATLDAAVGLIDVRVPADGVEISINGAAVGTSPLFEPIAVMPGRHEVGAVSAAGEAFSRQVTVAAGERLTVEVVFGAETTTADATAQDDTADTTGEEGVSPIWFWSSLGLAGALAIGGAVTGGLVLKSFDDFDSARDRCNRGSTRACDEGWDIAAHGTDLGVATTALFIAAGAVAATALTLAFFTDWVDERPEEPDINITAGPLVEPAGGGIAGFALGAALRF